MSTTPTNYDEIKRRSHIKKCSKESRRSMEISIKYQEQSEKWSNNRLKNELSSLIAEFSYLTDVPVKVSKNKDPKTAVPSFQVYAANTTPIDKDPFREPSYYDDDELLERKGPPMKTVEWEDNDKTIRRSPMHSPKISSIRSRKTNPARDKNVKKSRSKNKMNLKSKKSSRSRSRFKMKSPKRGGFLKPQKSRSRSGKRPIKPSPAERVEKVPRKSRSRRVLRRKPSRSKSEVEVIESRSKIKEVCVTTNEQKSGPRQKTCISQSEVETVERHSNPVRRRKRSRSDSLVRDWPLRCERRIDKKVEKRHPRRRIVIPQSEEKVVEKRPNPTRCRRDSRSGSLVRDWPLRCERRLDKKVERRYPRRRILQSEEVVVETRTNPIRRKRKSRSSSLVRYWPLRCERRMDKKVEKRYPRRRICESQSEEEVVEKRPTPVRCRQKSRSESLVRDWPLRCERRVKKVEERRPRRIICKSESEEEVVEKRSTPVRCRKKSRSESLVRYWPLRYERTKDSRVIIRRRQSNPILRKYEIKDTIPSEDATTITIYPKLQPKTLEPSLHPEFLTDSTLPCKCFQCMRKYNLFVKLPKEHCALGEEPCYNRKKILTDPWQNVHDKCTFDFGQCGIPPTGFHKQEDHMGLYNKLPYIHPYRMMNGYCGRPLEWFSGDSESGYTSTQSVKSVFFKFNCYTHHIASPIKHYFHSILGQTKFC